MKLAVPLIAATVLMAISRLWIPTPWIVVAAPLLFIVLAAIVFGVLRWDRDPRPDS